MTEVAVTNPPWLDEETPESVLREEEVDMDDTDDEDWVPAEDGSTTGVSLLAGELATTPAPAGTGDSRLALIQGCNKISSMEILSTGLSLRHFLTKS